jgi:hypothetical protein
MLYNGQVSTPRFGSPPNFLKASRFITGIENLKARYPACFDTQNDIDEVIECMLEGTARAWWHTICRSLHSSKWPAFTTAFLTRWAEPRLVIYQRWQSLRFTAGTDALELGDTIQTYARSLGVTEEQGVIHIVSVIEDAS